MLISCPSCAARYDVADSLIAATGRHVQCTACHTRWFERPPAGSQAPVIGENEILARLEARGGRHGRVIADQPLSEATAPQPEAAAGPHLRLVEPAPGRAKPEAVSEPEDKPASPEGKSSPAPAPEHTSDPAPDPADAVTDGAGKPAGAGDTGAPVEPSTRQERPEPAPAPSGRPRLDLPAPPPEEASEAKPVSPARSRARPILTAAFVIVALLALLYLAADPLADAVPALQPALGSYVGFLESMAEALSGQIAALRGTGSGG